MAMRKSKSSFGTKRLKLGCAAFFFVLYGCSAPSEDSVNKVLGIHSESIVLAKEQVQLSAEPTPFQPDRPLTLLGRKSSVCFVLRSGSVDIHNMDAVFDEIMQGAEIRVHLTTSDGKSLDRPATGEVLASPGVITGASELNACASVPLGDASPGKTQIKSISASSSEPMVVFGAYWKSSDETD